MAQLKSKEDISHKSGIPLFVIVTITRLNFWIFLHGISTTCILKHDYLQKISVIHNFDPNKYAI